MLLKRCVAVILTLGVILSFAACGCSNEKVKPSDISGSEVQEEFWNYDLKASAEKLNGYRAQSVEEVINNWRQAKMQGNGAIQYALYSEELKFIFLTRMYNEFGTWNFYYGKEHEKPQDVLMSEPKEIEEEDMIYSTVTSIYPDGATESYDIYISFVNGGYFVVDEQQPEKE